MPWFGRRTHDVEPSSATVDEVIPVQALALLNGLTEDWALLAGTAIRRRSSGFERLGVSSETTLTMPELRKAVERTAVDGETRTVDVSIGGAAAGVPPARVRARTCAVDREHVLLLLEDISTVSRVDAMRRDFIETVSRELTEPVAAMSTSARDMGKALRKGKPVGELASRVEADANRLSALVGDITSLSRLQATAIMDAAEPVNVADVVAQACDAVTAHVNAKRMTLHREVQDLTIHANSEQLVTALLNLLQNAITYSEPHTRIDVTAREVGAYVEIAVADQGMGIPHEHLTRIFERFHRVDAHRSRETGGTGLGLAIVRHICMAHGGDVAVESTVGKGSVFTLRLPSRSHLPA